MAGGRRLGDRSIPRLLSCPLWEALAMAIVHDAVSGDARRCAEGARLVVESRVRRCPSRRLSVPLDGGDRLPWWTHILAPPRQGRPLAVAVAEDDSGRVCGFGSSRVNPRNARSGEVAQLYVDPSAWGSGVADLLMAPSPRRARRTGSRGGDASCRRGELSGVPLL